MRKTAAVQIAQSVWLLAASLVAPACSPHGPYARGDAQGTAAESPSQGAAAKLGPRFVGMNVPNLHYIEDDWRFESRERYRLPTEFEIRDALASVAQMGGTVVRIYALSVRKPTDPPDVPRHVVGPGMFEESAFQALDRVFALAREYSIRLIVPFVDNWHWWGGVGEYAAFRGKSTARFWSDPELLADFERTIEHLILRRNTVTGVLYRDDPTLFAWETGNELEAPWAWTERVAAHIKELDPVHPVMDGIHARSVRLEALESPFIDILTTHHYASEMTTLRDIGRNLEIINRRKPYVVGEFGFLSAKGVEHVLDAAQREGAFGALLWSLRFHDEDGGFYGHCEKDGYEAYHWPGFPSGASYEEEATLQVVRREAFDVRGVVPDAVAPPAPPSLLASRLPGAVSWRGSAGASSYRVERASEDGDGWRVLAERWSDAEHPYRPIFVDTSGEAGHSYRYRVSATNSAGSSQPSPASQPMRVFERTLVDEFSDLSLVTRQVGWLRLVRDAGCDTRMDRDRVEGRGGSLIYRVPGTLHAVQVYAFTKLEASFIDLAVSEDGSRFERCPAETIDFRGRVDDAGATPVLVRARVSAEKASWFLIRVDGGSQVGRVEAVYEPR